jgi:hypothetical protein
MPIFLALPTNIMMLAAAGLFLGGLGIFMFGLVSLFKYVQPK